MPWRSTTWTSARDVISPATDKITEELDAWRRRPLGRVCTAVMMDVHTMHAIVPARSCRAAPSSVRVRTSAAPT